MEIVTARQDCPICQSKSLIPFLKREGVPVHQNLVMPDRRSAVDVRRGTLSLVACEGCGFVFNQSFTPTALSYGEAYDNTQTCSQVFQDYLMGLVREVVRKNGIRNCQIVEVGCGKGAFLRQLVEAEGGGNVGYGFDPSYAGPLVDLDGRLRFFKRYYDSTCAETSADAVICRHVIEHVPDPESLLQTMRQAVHASSHPRVFLETPCVEWILKHRVFWDFFYEHCSYFSAQSLTTAAELAGFRVERVDHIFGGQYLWLEATLARDVCGVPRRPTGISTLAKQFAAAEMELRQRFEHRIQEVKAQEGGRVAIWGAGAKGATFANLVDPQCQWLACVVDLNPNKQGHYIPGTGHPIISYRELPRAGVTTAILMNPNYYKENLALLEAADIKVRLLDLMN